MSNPRLRPLPLKSRRPDGLAAVGGTLETIYRRWEGLRAELAEAQAGVAAERARLQEEGSFLLGTVRAARELEPQPPPDPSEEASALAAPDALNAYVQEAEARMAEALASLEERAWEHRVDLEAQLAVARVEVVEALERHQTHAVPTVTLRRRPLAGGRAILHLDRPEPDAAMLWVWLFAGKPATRYGYLFDEAADDALMEPPTLYPDEGIPPDAVRPAPGPLRELLAAPATPALPVRGIIPFLVPAPTGGEALVRLRCRGPVLELEWSEGEAFRSILSAAEAEAAAGYLLRLQLSGRIRLQLAAG